MTRHGTPVGDPGPFTCSFFTPFTTSGFWETIRLVGSRKLAYSPVALAVVFRVGLFSFLSAKLGPVWPKPAPDRAGAGRSPTRGGNRHTGPPGGQTGGLGGSVGTALGRLCFDSSAVRSATRIGESCRSPVFRVTCVAGGKGNSGFSEGWIVSLLQIQDRKAAMCWKLWP